MAMPQRQRYRARAGAPIGCAVERDAARRRGAITPVTARISVVLPAPFAPMMATVSPRPARDRHRTAPESRRRWAVRPAVCRSGAVMPRSPDRFPAPRARPSPSSGRADHQHAAEVQHHQPSDDARSARAATCSIQMIVVPSRMDRRGWCSTSSPHSPSVRPPAISSSRRGGARWPGRGPVPAACAAAAAARRPDVGHGGKPGARPGCPGRSPVRLGRAGPPPKRRGDQQVFDRRSDSRRAAESGTTGRCPAAQRCIGGFAGDVAAVQRTLARIRARCCR